jgi:hypothetical protein
MLQKHKIYKTKGSLFPPDDGSLEPKHIVDINLISLNIDYLC